MDTASASQEGEPLEFGKEVVIKSVHCEEITSSA